MSKGIKNKKKPKNIVKNGIDNNLIKKMYIDFNQYPNWAYSYKGKKFTNALRNSDEAGQHFYFLVNELLGSIEKNVNEILANNVPHCHKLCNKKRNLAVKIVKKIHKITLDDDANIWQLCSDKNFGIRIVGVIVTDRIYNFYPLFIDHYHLMYPSKNYNEEDYFSFDFCPQEKW